MRKIQDPELEEVKKEVLELEAFWELVNLLKALTRESEEEYIRREFGKKIKEFESEEEES